MKKFLIYLVCTSLLFIILDKIYGNIVINSSFLNFKTVNTKLNHSIFNIREDVLIFGASRAQHHYNPKIISDSLSLSSYNLGSDGQNIYFHYALLKNTLLKHTPKVIILELSKIDIIDLPNWNLEKLGVLTPYTNVSKEIENIVHLKSNTEKYKTQLNAYKYNSLAHKVIYYGLLNKNIKGINDDNGFSPLKKVWDSSKFKAEKRTKEIKIDKVKLSYLDSFIQVCIDNNIKLYLIVSPFGIKTEIDNYATKFFSNYLNETYQMKIFDYSEDSMFLNKMELFEDRTHLNEKGATLFSKKVVNDILNTQK